MNYDTWYGRESADTELTESDREVRQARLSKLGETPRRLLMVRSSLGSPIGTEAVIKDRHADDRGEARGVPSA